MRDTTLIFLRHAETEKDPLANASTWDLSEDGRRQAKEIAGIPIMNSVDAIYVSEERKTALTAEPIERKIGKEIQPMYFFNEVRRGDKFLSGDDFKLEKARQLSDLSFEVFDGESGLEALNRFKKGISMVMEKNDGATVIIVTHGTILNIYFADLLGVLEELPDRWRKTSFCAYGIVKNGRVVKDIV